MRNVIIVVLVLAAVGGGIGLYLWNKPTTDVSGEKAEASVSATELMDAYDQDEAKANEQFLGKVIEVKGTVQKINTNDDGTVAVSLDGGSMLGAVVCNMSPDATDNLGIKEGDAVTIKGKCSGYLMDVILERSVVESQ